MVGTATDSSGTSDTVVAFASAAWRAVAVIATKQGTPAMLAVVAAGADQAYLAAGAESSAARIAAVGDTAPWSAAVVGWTVSLHRSAWNSTHRFDGH